MKIFHKRTANLILEIAGADLIGANLRGANLREADLRATCLDPENKPNGDSDGFDRATDGRCVGWRTTNSQHVGQTVYSQGHYAAPVFSTADTECHPGLYCYPTKKQVETEYQDKGVVEVRFDAADCHKAGRKWRVRKFEVMP